MGVDLGDIVPRERLALRDLAGTTLAIDGHNALYQFLSIIRQPDGTPLKDSKGRVTSHLSGLLYRTSNLVEAGIRPIYVFDGKPHARKFAVLRERRERKQEAQKQMEAALAAGDTHTAFSKATQTASLSGDMVQQSTALLDALGLPWLRAPQEGEAQASFMVQRGHADAAVSQDFDALLFGAPVLIRNLGGQRRKMPGQQRWQDVEPERLRLDVVLRELGLTREQLVGVGLLCGTDYNEGVRGYGPKKALKLVRETGTPGAALAKAGAPVEDVEALVKLFLEPEVTTGYELRWGKPDEAAVLALMCDEHDFSRDRVQAALAKFAAQAGGRSQRSLDAFL
jgi:flap endonuclease-1